VELERDEAEQRVWRMLSQYSQLHPEDFGSDEDGTPDKMRSALRRNSSGSSTKHEVEGSTPVEVMRRKLERQNEEIELLRANLMEAETGKEGMLERINQLVNRAQEKDVTQRAISVSPDKPPQHGGGDVASSDGAAYAWPGVVFACDKDGNCRVSDVVQGTPASGSRKVHIGDMLMTVGGVPAKGVSAKDLVSHCILMLLFMVCLPCVCIYIYVCMYVCIYIYTHTCIYIYIYIYIYMYTHTNTHTTVCGRTCEYMKRGEFSLAINSQRANQACLVRGTCIHACICICMCLVCCL
jgi:hypothetical protein